MLVLGWWLRLMILEVFSDLNDSVIGGFCDSQRFHNGVGRHCFVVGLTGSWVLQGSDLRVTPQTQLGMEVSSGA